MQFLDLAGVKKFKKYVDDKFTTIEDHESAEEVTAAALNDLNDRVIDIEDGDWVTAEDYSEIEEAHLDTYTKQEIDAMLAEIESGDSNAYVTALGTSGNNLTWTKNGTTNNITVPYSTNAGTASKLGNSTIGASNRPIYLNAGTPTVTNPGEAFLSWGGQNFSGSYGPIDASMVSELGACRTMFAKAAGIVIEYSTDSGTTWIDYGATDAQKVGMFSSGSTFYIGKSSTSGASSTNYMLRVTLRTSAAGIYTTLNKFVIFVGTNGSTGCYCTIRVRTQQNYEDNVDSWVTRAENIPISGWSGYNVINISGTTTYGNTKSSQYGEWQFIFGCTGYSGSSSGLSVSKIFGFGGVGWTTPSTMAKTGHLYSFDSLQNATFPNKVTAAAIAKSGGTSSQFLKADGSVDSNTYALASAVPSAVTESTVSGWGFTKNTGTVTQVKVGTTAYDPTSGVISLPAYPTTLPASDVSAWAKASTKPTYTASEVGALPSTTTIPAAPGTLITNATTAQTASSGQSMSGSITLHKVAKTGTYSDLIGTPTIPTVNNATLTIQKNGTTVNTFTANASSNVTANIQVNEVPSYSSSNNGQILSVVNGSLTWVTPAQIYSGSAAPSNSTGNNGDIYIQS